MAIRLIRQNGDEILRKRAIQEGQELDEQINHKKQEQK